MYTLFGIIVGAILTLMIVGVVVKKKQIGALMIDRSGNPDIPEIYLSITRSVNKLNRKKWIVLKVKESDDTRK